MSKRTSEEEFLICSHCIVQQIGKSLFNLVVLLLQKICLTVVVGRDKMGSTLVGKIIKNQKDDEDE